jgi:hypothetical protein
MVKNKIRQTAIMPTQMAYSLSSSDLLFIPYICNEPNKK